jgi:ERI1 exoribonuclease 3
MSEYVCILDFEATCWKNSNDHEIIEFPSILLKWETDKITEVSRIQLFVKPKSHPIVSKFCRELTGITQEQVNAGIDLKSALDTHKEWIKKHCKINEVTIVTCGHWDLRTMLQKDLKNNGLVLDSDSIYKRFVNIKDLHLKITNERARGMLSMLDYFELDLEGRHHSGIDDCHNISRIFIKLVESGLTKEIFINNTNYIKEE